MLVKFQEDQHSLFKNKKKEIKVNPRWRTKVERRAQGDEFGLLEDFHVIGGQVHSSRDPVEEGLVTGSWYYRQRNQSRSPALGREHPTLGRDEFFSRGR